MSLFGTRVVLGAGLLAALTPGLNGRARPQERPEQTPPPIATAAIPQTYGTEEGMRDRQDMGSTFVPLDSWVYPVFERLTVLGYLDTAVLGSKPWTRMECARLTDEVVDALRYGDTTLAEAEELQARLHAEFAYEMERLGGGTNRQAGVETLYARVVSISGPALTESYHFGQTISYDFGRPYQRGTNGQVGGSVRASVGPLAFHVRAEFQHAPAAPALSDAAITVMSVRDLIPFAEVPRPPTTPINRVRLLDAYASLQLNNWQVLVGRQSLSWTSAPDGSMLWSNNSEPVDMIRFVNAEPIELPGLLRHVGLVRMDQFVGRLRGHSYIPKPFIFGQKLSVKPFPYLELGFGRTFTLGGEGGDPITLANFGHAFSGVPAPNRSVPGDNHSAIDWIFRVPGLRNYVVLYGDAYADDDGLPLQNPGKNPWRPGIYLTRFPGIPKLDLHVEGVSTQQAGVPNQGLRDLNYWNQTYRDGYTNDGFLIGNTVGRYGRAIRGWMTYWISPRNTMRLGYKRSSVSAAFIPGGGSWQDYWVKNEVYFRSGLYLKSEVQYEHISRYPILFDGRKRNVTAIVELGFAPGEGAGN
jgi:hypothetical protein